jgi:hypothetical protein
MVSQFLISYKIGVPIPMRPQADFRGTISYASLNAHLKLDLSRRDDLWSFYFVILEFLDENIPWKLSKLLTLVTHL